MRRRRFRVGVRDKTDMKYMNGRCTMLLYDLHGSTPEAVEAANVMRLKRLNRTAKQMQRIYIEFSMRRLDEEFARFHVDCLSELIRVMLEERYFYMLSVDDADKLLLLDRYGYL